MMVAERDILDADILVVDDMQANVTLLEEMLKEAGYTRVTSTMNPAEVCGLHRRHGYDLILLDLQMPVMSGFEVMEGLKLLDPGGYLPVLVITAEPGHKLRALEAGAKDFISKPFDIVEVRTRIHNMLEVRLLYRKLADYNRVLEQAVLERTAELRASESRFRSLTELAADWYWEQDDKGTFTRVSGPVQEMLGIGTNPGQGGWDAAERGALHEAIAARRPFLDLIVSRVKDDGSRQAFRVSGEPIFGPSSRFAGFRGIGVEIATLH